MTHYLCFTGFKEMNIKKCPPTPASTAVNRNTPPDVIVDEDGQEWRFTGERYHGWPVYKCDD
jgi:hypothetical protein